MKRLLQHLQIPLLLFICSIPLVLPFFHSGYFPTHDGEWAVVRLSDMYREVRDGQIPPRFSGNLNFSYGYPLFNFAYPLPYYLGLVFYLLHFGLVNSTKLIFLLSVPLSGIAMYYACLRLSGSKLSAYIGAVLYMYLPYRMVDLYVRGSIGESVASVLFPLIFLSLVSIKEKKSYLWSSLLSFSFASIILAHNIMATYSIIMIALFLFGMILRKNRQVITVGISLVIGLGLSAFFWLPALVEKHLILLSKIPIADRDLYYIPLSKLIYSPFGYGTPTDSDSFSYQIGLFHLIFLIFAVAVIIYLFVKRRRILQEQIIISTVLCIFFFLLFPFSSVVWEQLPLLKEINYPWTLLLPIGFMVSLLIGSIRTQHRFLRMASIILLIGNCCLVTTFAHPKEYVDRGDGYYFTNDATTTSSRELMPLTVVSMPQNRPVEKVEIRHGEGKIALLENKSQKVSFTADIQQSSLVRLNTIYFPGWHWYEDGKEIKYSYSNKEGVMETTLLPGNHTITARFENTPIRSAANILSIVSFLGLGTSIIVMKRKNYLL